MPTDRQTEESAAGVEPRERLSDAADPAAPSVDGEAAAGARPSNTHLPSSQVESYQDQVRQAFRQMHQGLLLNGDGYSGPLSSPDLFPNAVAAIDWLDEGGIIEWSGGEPGETFLRLEELQDQAREARKEQEYELAGQTVMVFPMGLGHGNQERLPIRIGLPGITIGLSRKASDSRQHPNFSLSCPGEPCLLLGALRVRRMMQDIVAALGGFLRERWTRRIDLCLDLPGLSIGEWILPKFQKEHFKTTFKEWPEYKGELGSSGFSFGSKKRVKFNIYDKLREVRVKKTELYRQAMIQHRWRGSEPSAATRIEYQIRSEWLGQYCMADTDHVLQVLPAIMERLTEPDKRPTFVFTTTKPDRKNKHQSRCIPEPKWVKLVCTFRELIGNPTEPLKRVKREAIRPLKAAQMLIGFGISAAAVRGALLSGKRELAGFILELLTEMGIEDEVIADKSRWKCAKLGTLKDAQSFNSSDFDMGA